MLIATCDVHFLNAKDSIYRAILMKGKGFEDAENNRHYIFAQLMKCSKNLAI